MMIRNTSIGISIFFTLFISLGLTGCKTDDEETPSKSGGSGSAGSSGGTERESNTFTGILISNLDDSPVPGCTVKALDNATLEELGPQAVSAANGTFRLDDLPPGEMCVFAVGAMQGDYPRIDTYTYNVETDEQNREIYSIPMTVAEFVTTGMCGPSRTDVGTVTGGVWYLNDKGEEFEVDCATVEVEEATEDTVVYYFSGDLPSTGDQAEPCDRPDIGTGRVLETQAKGRFYATNLPPGIVHLTAKVNGKAIGSTTMKVIPPAQATGGQYNSNITRIYADEPGDPTPNCVPQQQ